LAKTGSIECRFFDTKTTQWTRTGVARIQDFEYTICTTNHLSDFATFIAMEEPAPDGFNLHWLWLLLLIIPGIAIIGTMSALLFIIIKKFKSILKSHDQTPLTQQSSAQLDLSTAQENLEPSITHSTITDEKKDVSIEIVNNEELPEIPVDVIVDSTKNQSCENIDKKSESIKEEIAEVPIEDTLKDDIPDIPSKAFKQSNTENTQIVDFSTIGERQLLLLKKAIQKHYKE
jgi:hypothetical protein